MGVVEVSQLLERTSGSRNGEEEKRCQLRRVHLEGKNHGWWLSHMPHHAMRIFKFLP
jgi:hypothetical protein